MMDFDAPICFSFIIFAGKTAIARNLWPHFLKEVTVPKTKRDGQKSNSSKTFFWMDVMFYSNSFINSN